MDRIINVRVSGNHLTKDGRNAGTRGEANATILRIEFDVGWDGYAKSVVFLDAHGMNPTRWTLTTNLLENAAESTRIYLVPIPAEPLAVAGELTFSVEGYVDGKRQRSVSDTLEVQDTIITDVVNDPTPTQAEQLQAQYESIMEDIQKSAIYRNEAEAFAENAEASAENAENSAKSAEQTKEEVEALKLDAEASIETRKQAALDDIESLHQETLGDIDARKQAALDDIEGLQQETIDDIEELKRETTEVVGTVSSLVEEAQKAQARAEENASAAATSLVEASEHAANTMIWADQADASATSAYTNRIKAEESANRAENALGKTNYIGENGNWYAWDSELNDFYDTGVKGQSGSTVYKGDNPPPEADVWVDTSGEGSGVVLTPDDAMLASKHAVPSMFTMSHYIQEAVSNGGGGSADINKDEVLSVLGTDIAFEDLGWSSDKETKLFILKKGDYRVSPTCTLEIKEDGICIMTRNALEYHTTYFFITFICESGIKFFDFIDGTEDYSHDTDSPNRELSFANIDSILTFDKIEDSSTTFPCIHLMSPNGTAYMVTVNDDGQLEATPHD